MKKLINLKKLLRQSRAVYRAKFPVLFGLLVLPFTLFIISPLLVQSFDFLYLPLSLLLTILGLFLLLWGGTAAIIVIRDRDENLSIREALERSKGKIWPLLWVSIIVGFIVVGASILFLIPGLILAVYFIFAKIIVVAEDETGLVALAKSREYVRDYFWPVLGRYLVIVILTTIVVAIFAGIISALSQALISVWGRAVSEALVIILQALVNAIIFPFVLSATYLLYENVREVKGEVSVEEKNNQAWIYLGVGLAGWIFLAVLIVLAIVILTTAIGGYVLGAFASNIFNSQALIKATSTLAQ